MTIRRRKCPAIIIVRPERKRTPHGDTVPLGGSLVRVERPADHGVDTVARHEQIGLDTTHGPRRGDGRKGPPPVHSPRARGPRTLSRRWSEPRARAPRGASSVHRHRRPGAPNRFSAGWSVGEGPRPLPPPAPQARCFVYSCPTGTSTGTRRKPAEKDRKSVV